jgi:hypothetical protein
MEVLHVSYVRYVASIAPRTARIPQADAAVVAVLPGNQSLVYFDTHAALTAGARGSGDPKISESLALAHWHWHWHWQTMRCSRTVFRDELLPSPS